MSLATAFRLSFFVTLGLACAALALAETFFLWWMGLFLVGTVAMLVLAYRCEGRWELSADAANRLGMVIAIGAAFWILYNLPRTEEDLVMGGVPWPAGLLPHLGPLLMVLLLVKLFRPKRLADFWALQTIGLMMVTLACVLAGEPMFGLLLILYLAALLWSLALFYLVREEAQARAAEPGKLPLFGALDDETAAPLLPWRFLGLGRVVRWTLGVVVAGVALFFVAPRQGNWQWMPKQLTSAAKGAVKTGIDGGMDLNRVGKIELSDEPAFEVAARTNKGPKLDLDLDTRWFVQVLDFYALGRWSSWSHGSAPPHLTWGVSPEPKPLALPSVEGVREPQQPPPDLKDDEFYLFFKVRVRAAGGLVLAEPLQGQRLGLYPHTAPSRFKTDASAPDPRLLKDRPQEASFFFHLVGIDTVLASPQATSRLNLYGQVQPPIGNRDWLPAKAVNPRYRQFLVNQELPERIQEFTRQLLDRLPELTEADRALDPRGRIAPPARAKVARALCRHLAFSGDYGYSLELRRKQLAIDPLADFLVNVKEGHCERFAGGLTLMLRSVGIPARVIRGYRGVSPLEEDGPGKYVVRQNQAHSWVQALVPDPDPARAAAAADAPEADKIEADKVEAWLTLDPTPGTERASQPLLSWLGWLLDRWNDSDGAWRTYVLEYNSDVQARTLQTLWWKIAPDNPWKLAGAVTGFGALAGAGFLALRSVRRWRRRGAADAVALSLAAGTGFYGRFLDVSARFLDLRPDGGQTPREFSLAVGARLSQQLALPGAARQGAAMQGAARQGAAVVPLELVELLYRVRYGGHALTAAEQAEADRRLNLLETVLRDAPNAQEAPAAA